MVEPEPYHDLLPALRGKHTMSLAKTTFKLGSDGMAFSFLSFSKVVFNECHVFVSVCETKKMAGLIITRQTDIRSDSFTNQLDVRAESSGEKHRMFLV
jgi:hypothetical protein